MMMVRICDDVPDPRVLTDGNGEGPETHSHDNPKVLKTKTIPQSPAFNDCLHTLRTSCF